MAELLTASQMRAIEQAAIDGSEVTGLELMERAGRGVVEAITEEWPELAVSGGEGALPPSPAATPPEYFSKDEGGFRAVVLCGPGNNGGDGFVVARLLRERGWRVEVFLYGDPERLPPDAKANYERWGADVGRVDDYTQRKEWGCDLLVDALFGTGLKRGLQPLGELFRKMGEMVACFAVEPRHDAGRPAIVAVDIPSGVCADSGRVFPPVGAYGRSAATAHLTVAFHKRKIGHALAEGPGLCGKTVVKDIGLVEDRDWLAENQDAISRMVLPDRSGISKAHSGQHKYSYGHALILTGGFGRTGAARLAARGALRIGAGLVTLGVPGAAQAEVAAQITALMLRRVDDADALLAVLEDRRINALCLGPGLGLDARSEGLVAALCGGQIAHPTVLDADALTILARRPDLMAGLGERRVLTPHAGEFARLFPDIARNLAADPISGPAFSKVDATRAAAERAGCVVLFKGADTVIAHPDGRCSINAAVGERAAPWLATAGSGDVLAGFITGLLARGFDPMRAAETAAWLHVACARSFGPGLIAEDLAEKLPKVFRGLDL